MGAGSVLSAGSPRHIAVGLRRRFDVADRGADGLRLAADLVLAKQRDHLDPHAGLHDQQHLRPQQSGRSLAKRDAVGRGHRPFPESDGPVADFAMSYANLGAALDASGQSDAAAAAYMKADLSPCSMRLRSRKALETNPNSWLDRVNLGNALAGCGRARRGGGRVSKALRTGPIMPSPTTTSPTC